MYLPESFKAFALTGRQPCVHNNPGRCPGLRASALSGRAVGELLPFTFSLRLVTVGLGRAVGELLLFTFSLFPSAGDRWFRACCWGASALYLSLRLVTVGSGRAGGVLLDLLGVPTVQVETYCSIQVITHYSLGNRVVAFDPEKAEYTQTKKTFAFLFF